jgi:hypothetical protein
MRNLKIEMGEYTASLAIPNLEVKLVYRTMFRNWLYKAAPTRADIDDLVKAMLSGDSETLQEVLGVMFLRILSYQDAAGRQPEKLYHGMILGLLVHLESEYDVRSNRESGRGRADMLIRPKKPGKPGVVIKFKVLKPNETVEQALKRAAEQVRNRKYAEDVRASGASVVHEYAMVFDGKEAWVRKVEELLDRARLG